MNLSGTFPVTALAELTKNVEENGFAIVDSCLNEQTIEQLTEEMSESIYAQRNLLSVPMVRKLAKSNAVRELICSVLGPNCFAVKGIFFNKTQSSNWKVAWHQDLTIAVSERLAVDGVGPWTVKAGVVHVQPPTDVMAGMVAIRLHLDDSGLENGPLRVIPGSHKTGRLSNEQIASWQQKQALTCTVARGGAVLMRPLLLHASSACSVAEPRRVIHLEFAATELPHGLRWHDRA
jgi:ectoine hydroxylase-related dioxygenase (phytanoyl-CoA dioxygenase family)